MTIPERLEFKPVIQAKDEELLDSIARRWQKAKELAEYRSKAINGLMAQVKELKRVNDSLAAQLLKRPSIAPADMQDGKRYAVTLDGTYRHSPGDDSYGWLDLPNGELEDFHIAHATHIEPADVKVSH